MRRLGLDRGFVGAMLRLALPIALQNLLVSSFVLVDTYMIGALGDIPLAAVGMAGQVSWLLNIVLFGFSSGAAVFIAQYWGARDDEGIRRTYGLALVCALAAAVAFLLLGLLGGGFVMALFTRDAEARALGEAYLRIACLSYPAIAVTSISGTVLRSTERVKLPLMVSAISVAVNAALNALFIYGLGMGVRGAAIATVISAWVSPAAIYAASLREKNVLIVAPRQLLRLDGPFVRHYARISLPVLFNESLWALGTVCVKLIFSNKSTSFYAALTLFGSLDGLTFSFLIGLCHASAVMIGKSVGAGDFAAARRDGVRFTRMVVCVAAGLGLFLIAIRDVALLPFGNVTGETRELVRGIIAVYGVEVALRNVPYITIVGVFRAGGDTKFGLRMDMLFLWCVSLPITFVCAYFFNMNLLLVYAVMLLSEDLPKSLMCLSRLRGDRWIRPVTEKGRAEAQPDPSSL